MHFTSCFIKLLTVLLISQLVFPCKHTITSFDTSVLPFQCMYLLFYLHNSLLKCKNNVSSYMFSDYGREASRVSLLRDVPPLEVYSSSYWSHVLLLLVLILKYFFGSQLEKAHTQQQRSCADQKKKKKIKLQDSFLKLDSKILKIFLSYTVFHFPKHR